MLTPLRLRPYRAVIHVPNDIRRMLGPELEDLAENGIEEETRALAEHEIDFRIEYELHVAKHGRESRPGTMCD